MTMMVMVATLASSWTSHTAFRNFWPTWGHVCSNPFRRLWSCSTLGTSWSGQRRRFGRLRRLWTFSTSGTSEIQSRLACFFVCLFVRLFVCSFVRLLVRSFVRLFDGPFARSFACSPEVYLSRSIECCWVSGRDTQYRKSECAPTRKEPVGKCKCMF